MAAAESRAEAAFRELLAQGTTQRRQQRPQRLPGLLQHHQQQQERRTVIKPVGEQTPLRPTAMGLQELLLVLGDGASTTGARKAALTALRTRLDAPQQQQGPMQEEQNNHEEHEGERVFQATFPAVLKSMADPSDSCRELALQVFSAFLECGVDVAASLPRLFAVLTARLPAGLHHDAEAGLFVYDEAAHDAHQRGKAIPRQDKGHHAGPDSAEPAEAVRLASFQLLRHLLNTCAAKGSAMTLLRTHFRDAVLVVQHHLRDSSPDVRIEACQLLGDVAREAAYEPGIKAYALALIRALFPSLRHPLARVRAAALGAIGDVVAVPDRAKCRGAGSGAIEELVGFRLDNVLRVAAFYRVEVDVNYLAELVRDPQASVRLRLLEVLRRWLQHLPDRRCHDARLVPYLLTLLNDPIQRVQEQALATILACGEQYLAEERARQSEAGATAAGAADDDSDDDDDDDDADGSLENGASLLSKLRRPHFAARLYVRSATRRALPVVAEELSHWTAGTRFHSAQLIRVLLLFHGRHILSHLHLLLPAVVKGLAADEAEQQKEEGSGGSGGAGPVLLDCARVLGRLIQGTGEEEREAFTTMAECLLDRDGFGGGGGGGGVTGSVCVSTERGRAVAVVRSAMGLRRIAD